MQRTSPSSVLFTSYNVLNLFAADSAEARQHYEMIVGVIRALDTDVLAVQEILAPDSDTAAQRLRQLADDAGLRCEVPGPAAARDAALAFGGHGYHVGLMWRDGIEPVPGSLRRYGGRDFWHGLAVVTLDVGGTADPAWRLSRVPVQPGAAGRPERAPGGRDHPARGRAARTGRRRLEHRCADRILSADWELYEPADPYAGVDWFADLIYQCQWDYDEQGRRRHWADRRPGDVLWSGGLHDVAALIGADWQPTAGHHPHDVYGAHGVRRRIDAVRVTGPLAEAMSRAPGARHRADPGGFGSSAGNGRVPARRARQGVRGASRRKHGSASAPSVTSLNAASRLVPPVAGWYAGRWPPSRPLRRLLRRVVTTIYM